MSERNENWIETSATVKNIFQVHVIKARHVGQYFEKRFVFFFKAMANRIHYSSFLIKRKMTYDKKYNLVTQVLKWKKWEFLIHNNYLVLRRNRNNKNANFISPMRLYYKATLRARVQLPLYHFNTEFPEVVNFHLPLPCSALLADR